VKKPSCGSVYVRERARRGNPFARAKREFLGASVVAAGLALVAPFAAFAQTSAIPARIVTQINESSLTTLRGNTHPLARPQYDQGAVADSMPMHRMLLLLQRSAQQETALRTLIDQQQSKTSPSFHQWLTPQQFGQQYGAAPADIQTVTSWLTSHGFQVARVSTAGTLVEFSGTAGQVLNAFHTQIHRYVVNGEERFANSTDPQIPTALASVVAGPVSLHNFPRKAQSHIRGVFQKDIKTGRVTAVPSPTFTFASTDCTSNTIFSSNCFAIAPGDFDTIYNVNPLLTTGISGHVIDGTGQTIAIVGDSEICTASSPDFSGNCTVDDVANFRSLFGLSTTNLPNVILDGPDPGFNGDEIEGNLDVQWSGAIAPGATIDFVIAEGTEVSAGTDLAAEYIVDNNLAPVMSESFSQCEAFLLANGNLFESALWEQAAAQGITVIVSAGDSGSAGCDDQSSQTSAVNGANVNGIASTPFNVAAGGTDFDFTTTNYPSAYWLGPTSNSATDVSAQGYIPETTWNDSCARSGLTGCNSISATSPLLNIVGGGGGQSTCVAAVSDVNGNISCPTASYTNATIGGWTKPAYQPTATGSGLTLANDLTRDVPDISLFASDGILSNSFYIVCEADISGGQCNLSQSFINFVGVGGTSSSAPSFAGIMALVNENMAVNHSTPTGQGQGNANYVLYPLLSNQVTAGLSCNSSAAPNTTSVTGCTFYDVTKGNNSVPCAAGSFNCSNTGTTGLGVVETGTPANTPSYIAGTGFDLATGLGSINAFNLVNNWFGTAGSFTPTTTTVCLSTTSGACTSSTTASSITGTVTHGTTTIYVNIGVTSASGAPSNLTAPEDVALIGTSPAPCTANCPIDRFDPNTGNVDIYQLTSGTATGSTNELVGGMYTISARYGGDGKFGSSTSTPGISITVVPENSTTSLSVFAASGNNSVAISTVPYGAFDTIRADVKGVSGLETGTGTVTLLDNGNPIVTPFDTTSNSFPLNTEGYTEDQTTFLSVGTHNFTGQYGGDASYNASAISTAVPLTVSLGPTTTTAHSSVTSVAPNTNFTLTAFIDTQSSTNPTGGSQGLSPSGTVTFFSGTTSLGSAPVSAISGGDANGFDESTATLATAKLAATGTITAVYNGDVNYSTSTSSGVTVTVTSGATFNLSPANNGVMTVGAPGQSGTDTITVTGSGGFSGTITLSSAVSMTPPSATDIPTCSFGAPDQNFTAPGTITLSTTSETGSATMTCATTAAAHIVPGPSSRPSGRVWPLAGVAISLAGIFFLLMVPSQRRWKLVPLVVLLAVVAAAGISCSGGGSGAGGGVTNPGTTTGTYTFTVTATPSNGTAQTTAITVNVQ
jgi:hypothetical protein